MNTRRTSRCLAAGLAIAAHVSAQPCEPGWDVGIGNPGMTSDTLDFQEGKGLNADAMLVAGAFWEPVSMLGLWDGSQWVPFEPQLITSSGIVDVVYFDDGNGEKLYILGNLYVGGNDLWHVARLDEGNQWTFLDNGDPANGVSEMIVWDDGTGPGLYVTGDFVTLDGVTTHNDIARWDGTQWLPLNNGLNFSGTQIGLTFEVYDDGNGEKLYLGGTFNRVDGQHIDYLAAWDGQEWSEPWFGTGPNDSVKDLCVYDDGNGPALYAVGCFEVASGESVRYVAKYDGTGWYDLDGGTVSPGCLNACGVYDEGDGPNLFVSGSLNDASGKPMKKIARWDGAEWHSPDGGITSGQGAFAMLGLPPDSPFGSTMFVGGAFTGVGGQASNYIAEYRGCYCRPDLNNDGTVNTQDFLTFLNLWAARDPIADWNTDGTINTQDFLAYLNEWVAGC